MSLSRR